MTGSERMMAARVQTFVPILVEKRLRATLRSERDLAARPERTG